MVKLGIIREGKVPPDARTPLSPDQCVQVKKMFGVELVVEPSPVRCFTDAEYEAAGIELTTDLSDCDVLLGVKEVPVAQLMADRTYLFFSHTVKKQHHNRKLLQAVLEKNIRLIDYEMLTDERGDRLIAFGFYAGLVGSHNAVWTYGRRTGLFDMPRMQAEPHYADIKPVYASLQFPPMRIVLTGNGRVASGAVRNLHDMHIHQVSPRDFLHKEFDRPVFTQLFAHDYVQHRDGPQHLFSTEHFFAHGEEYRSIFAPYYRCADIMINAIYYDKKAPAFFTAAEMTRPDFRLQVIADISCDLMPDASVPCTLRPGTIANPVYGFDPRTGSECAPHEPGAVDVMAVDNLPSELPRDASIFFGKQLIDNVLPELLHGRASEVINRALLTEQGLLMPRFEYLSDFVAEAV